MWTNVLQGQPFCFLPDHPAGAGLAACGLAAAAGVRRTRKQRRSMAGTSLVGNLGEWLGRCRLGPGKIRGVLGPFPTGCVEDIDVPCVATNTQ